MIHDRIDLTTAPSAMETEAARWGARATPRPCAPSRVGVRIAPLPPRRPRPFHDAVDHGQPGYFGADAEAEQRAAEQQARRDALKAVARDIPNVAAYARQMPTYGALAIANAEHNGAFWQYRAEEPVEVIANLRSVGLCYLEDRGLTHFACLVRRELVD